jgi:hypothetical protein
MIPGMPYSFIGWNCTNGYKGIKFESLAPHTTKQFYVSISGQMIKTNTKISFKVTHWETEPSSFSLKTTKEQAIKKPKDFQDYFSNDIKESDKTENLTVQAIFFDYNPYFPKIKDYTPLSTFFGY